VTGLTSHFIIGVTIVTITLLALAAWWCWPRRVWVERPPQGRSPLAGPQASRCTRVYRDGQPFAHLLPPGVTGTRDAALCGSVPWAGDAWRGGTEMEAAWARHLRLCGGCGMHAEALDLAAIRHAMQEQHREEESRDDIRQ